MKIFHCDHCGQLLFFENTECVSCHHRVAYLPDLQLVGSLDPDGAEKWRSPLARAAESGYRLCQNDKIEGICNWAVPASDDNPLCVSCRLTRVIPNVADPAHRAAWYRLEVAKRRLLFTLIELGLPTQDGIDDPKRALVPADLCVEQLESRARARRRVPVRPLACGDRQVEVVEHVIGRAKAGETGP